MNLVCKVCHRESSPLVLGYPLTMIQRLAVKILEEFKIQGVLTIAVQAGFDSRGMSS